ncbi:hypothetical protein BDP67DRAFT_116358 [Colletotrichum lupini]|nr:hypothetical protein BDP67DRAFT_116358 [Colletotrichum lupini]
MGGKAFRTWVRSLFYFLLCLAFLVHSAHWPVSLPGRHNVRGPLLFLRLFTVHDIVRRFFLLFSLHANLYRHPLECLGSGLDTFSLWEGRLSALRHVDGDGSGGFTDTNPTNQAAVGTGARFVCRPVAAG